jgi:VanZ family protein
VARAYQKGLCFLWAAWIFGSSCTVITRKQLVAGASVATHASQQAVSNAWESVWWIFVKGYHVLEFTVLTLLLIAAVPALKRNPLVAALLAVVYAATDEWHQTFVPHRGGHITDVLIDSFGVVIALGLFFVFQHRKLSKESPA